MARSAQAAPAGKLREPRPRPAVYRAYWYFAAERQRIFDRRLAGDPEPWSEDPIFASYRFCNSFRASDRVSQYLIRDVIHAPCHADPRDRVLRTILFRLFSRPETWELIEERCGQVSVATFDPAVIGPVLDEAKGEGRALYTNAFILCANRSFGHKRKHRNHLALLELMLTEELPERLLCAAGLREIYDLLIAYPLIGPFMAYQLAIDLNYGPDFVFSENEFTVPGPGAVRGLAKVFYDLGDLTPAEAVHWLCERQASIENELDIEPPLLLGKRELQAIDCQNLLCELDKYARVEFPALKSNRVKIKQAFKAAGPLPQPFYPPRWNLRPPAPRRRRGAPPVPRAASLAA